MPSKPKAETPALGGHLAIGMLLGVLFSAALPLCGDRAIFGLIVSGSSPYLVLAMYVAVNAMTFGIGATLTGLVLETTDQQGKR